MRAGTKTDLAENKLILLFMASRMPSGLEHDEFVRLNDEGGWMLYFDMEQYLLELAEDGLLAPKGASGQKLYAVTAEGLNVLGLLKTRIPLSIRSYIGATMAERRTTLEQKQEISAEYIQDSACEFPVVLRIFENQQPLMELNMTAPSAEAAELVCRRFREQGADLFAGLVTSLTREKDPAEDAG